MQLNWIQDLVTTDAVLGKVAGCLFFFVRYIARGGQDGKDKKPGFGPVFFSRRHQGSGEGLTRSLRENAHKST